ncbi:MAG: hypothetical protein KKE35_07325 [Actinobacteria bacterium]|nr:hypothetical protein [Actinomycetota bacterium]
MEAKIMNFISSLKFGGIKEFKNVTVIPIFKEISGGPEYISMQEAMSRNFLKIGEIGKGGSVQELVAENIGVVSVLLLDGEELIGAKQNRVLNTTILIDASSKVTIPVSCVEAHRWSSVSEHFSNSDSMLNYDIRKEKSFDVSNSLRFSGAYRSNQGKVWNQIDEMAADLKVKSGTGAMKDVFNSVEEQLEEYIKNFNIVPEQKGLFVFIDGKIAGFDVLSLSSAYGKIHSKLIKSYSMDAIRSDSARREMASPGKNKNADAERKGKKDKSQTPDIYNEQAKYFIEEIKDCNETKFKSAGLGYDYRYEGEFCVGSALLVDEYAIHMAFFKNSKTDKIGNISSYRDRMRNKI